MADLVATFNPKFLHLCVEWVTSASLIFCTICNQKDCLDFCDAESQSPDDTLASLSTNEVKS